MKQEIHKKILQSQTETMNMYLKGLGILENESIQKLIPKKNLDFLIILDSFGLLPDDEGTGEIIDDFHDYLFEEGIKLGYESAKTILFKYIKEHPDEYEKYMDIDSEKIVKYNFIPTFIEDLINDLGGE